MKEIANGIHTDISIEEYHANKSHISATQIKKARESLKHFNWYMTGQIIQEEKTCFGFGNAFELALVNQKEYLSKVAVMPDGEWVEDIKKARPELVKIRASKEYTAEYDKWKAANRGKYEIMDQGPESFETIECMLDSCNNDKYIRQLIDNTEYQVSLFWTDEATGLNLKTRPDVCKRKKNVLVNIKTIDDGSPDAFSRELAKWDYPLQACIEMVGSLKTRLMPTIDTYLWLVCEKKPPYNATIYEFSQDDISNCMDLLRFTLDRIAKAKKENVWPGYGGMADNPYSILIAKIPSWYKL